MISVAIVFILAIMFIFWGDDYDDLDGDKLLLLLLSTSPTQLMMMVVVVVVMLIMVQMMMMVMVVTSSYFFCSPHLLPSSSTSLSRQLSSAWKVEVWWFLISPDFPFHRNLFLVKQRIFLSQQNGWWDLWNVENKPLSFLLRSPSWHDSSQHIPWIIS